MNGEIGRVIESLIGVLLILVPLLLLIGLIGGILFTKDRT